MVEAGFRKENLPDGTWSFLRTCELLQCKCGQYFAAVPIDSQTKIIELEEAVIP
jgi:hypothetical protein